MIVKLRLEARVNIVKLIIALKVSNIDIIS